MFKRFIVVLMVLVLGVFLLAACGGGEEPTPVPPPPTEAPAPAPTDTPMPAPTTAPEPTEAPMVDESVVSVGMVSDVGGIDDKSFNQTVWNGLQDAIDQLGVDGVFLESQQQTDYEKNINEFLAQNKDLIVTVGFLLSDATTAAAEANPDAKFAIVDFPSTAPNVQGMLFDIAQATFLGGYLAAGMSETGVVCTFGGVNIPPVSEFMVGFQSGVEYYNAQKGADVQVLGWDNAANDGAFTGNFESTDDGRRFAENFFDEGCDVIMPVAGPVGLGSAAAAQDRGLMIIGVDTDQYVSAPEFGDVWLTSILKNMDKAVFDTVSTVVDDTFAGGTDYIGTLANDGVGLGPFHDFEDKVPAELQSEIEVLRQDIVDGKIDVRTGEMMEAMGEPITVGMVSDVGGIDDKSFNQTVWNGLQDAIDQLGVDGVFLESQQQTDYEKNINEFLAQNKDLIVTVGFLLSDATTAAAEANPDAKFAIVDFPSTAPNVQGMLFDIAQATFLGGYLAAGMSETGVVCTFGGVNIPPVSEFMVGFQNGVEYYNEQKGADVQVLGWDNAANDGAFTGNFESTDDGRRFAENFFDEGCDVIMPVAGPVGLGSAAAAQDRGLMIIGVDTDQYVSAPEFGDVWLTSILKNMDKAVFDTIAATMKGNFGGGSDYIGTLSNDGVGLGPFHDFEDKVSAELQAEIEALRQAIIDGDVPVK